MKVEGTVVPMLFFFKLNSTPWRRIGEWRYNFTPRPLYHQGKTPWYPLGRRLVYYT